jgi:hypothetical protein
MMRCTRPEHAPLPARTPPRHPSHPPPAWQRAQRLRNERHTKSTQRTSSLSAACTAERMRLPTVGVARTPARWPAPALQGTGRRRVEWGTHARVGGPHDRAPSSRREHTCPACAPPPQSRHAALSLAATPCCSGPGSAAGPSERGVCARVSSREAHDTGSGPFRCSCRYAPRPRLAAGCACLQPAVETTAPSWRPQSRRPGPPRAVGAAAPPHPCAASPPCGCPGYPRPACSAQ